MKNYLKEVLLVIIIFSVYGCAKDITTKPKILSASVNRLNSTDTVNISGVSPSMGIIYSAVTLTGNFDSSTNNVIKFNGVNGVINSVTPTQLVATVPGGATTGKITVTANGHTATSTIDFNVLQLVNKGSIKYDTNYLAYAIASTLINVGVDKLGAAYLTINPYGPTVYKYYNGQNFSFYGAPPGEQVFGDGTMSYYDISAIVPDNKGNVYIAQNYISDPKGVPPHVYLQSKIIKIDATGDSSVFVGRGKVGNDDGNGTNASFNGIQAMVFDTSGNLYVADFGNSSLRKVTPSGTVSTISNTFKVSYLAIDNSGNIYGNDKSSIIKCTPSGVVSTIIAQNPQTNGDYIYSYGQMFYTQNALIVKYFVSYYDVRVAVINTANHFSTFIPQYKPYIIATDNNGNFYNWSASTYNKPTTITQYTFK